MTSENSNHPTFALITSALTYHSAHRSSLCRTLSTEHPTGAARRHADAWAGIADALSGDPFPRGGLTSIYLGPGVPDPVPALVMHHLRSPDLRGVRYCMPGFASAIYTTDTRLLRLAHEGDLGGLEVIATCPDAEDSSTNLLNFGLGCPPSAMLLIDIFEYVDPDMECRPLIDSLRALASSRSGGSTVIVWNDDTDRASADALLAASVLRLAFLQDEDRVTNNVYAEPWDGGGIGDEPGHLTRIGIWTPVPDEQAISNAPQC